MDWLFTVENLLSTTDERTSKVIGLRPFVLVQAMVGQAHEKVKKRIADNNAGVSKILMHGGKGGECLIVVAVTNCRICNGEQQPYTLEIVQLSMWPRGPISLQGISRALIPHVAVCCIDHS